MPAEEVSGVKLNTKNYLMKQQVKNLSMGALELVEPYSDPCAAYEDSGTRQRISVIPRIRDKGYQFE